MAEILQKPARFGSLGVIAGHAILSVGLGMVLAPTVTNISTVGVLGTIVGALGLLSVKQMLSDRAAGTDGLIMALAAIVSIALGTLIGASIYKWFTESFGWWQLQLGRTFRRRNRRKGGKPRS